MALRLCGRGRLSVGDVQAVRESSQRWSKRDLRLSFVVLQNKTPLPIYRIHHTNLNTAAIEERTYTSKSIALHLLRTTKSHPSHTSMPPAKQKQTAIASASTHNQNIPTLNPTESAMIPTKTGEEEKHTPERSPAKRGPMTITEAQKQALMDNLQLEGKAPLNAHLRICDMIRN